MTRRAQQHPVTTHLPLGNHRAMAEHWGREVARCIAAAIATPRPTTIEDFDLDHAVRATRVAYGHAMKASRYRDQP